jgi:hypothetical protein
VQLPASYHHGSIPDTVHLLKSEAIMTWINNYHPGGELPAVPDFGADSSNILWAAEVWYGIKKHWVLELQQLIRKKGLAGHAG